MPAGSEGKRLSVGDSLFAPVLAAVHVGEWRLDWRWVAAGVVIIAVFAVGYYAQKPKEPNPGISDGDSYPLSSNDPTSPSSRIFVVNNFTGTNGGLADLVDLMGRNGSPFYGGVGGANSGSGGLVAADDIVIIKVNSQWNQRGGANTDLLRELISLILAHPDGFRGKVVVADNGQAQYGSRGQGGSFDWEKSNAEDRGQSNLDVVDGFSGSRVSTYSWDAITTNRVAEYSAGDDADGYVVEEGVDHETGLMVSYPKFTTSYGTRISFKLGVWDPSRLSYDSGRLKVINLPVLKTHVGYGVTGAVKSYMGVPSDKLTAALGHRTHSVIDEGAMGTLMAQTRFPAITILDCIWVNAVPLSGSSTSYDRATRVNVVAASLDPVALDYWAAKNILMKTAPSGADTSSMNPDNLASGGFGDWLRRSAAELEAAGLPSELDPNCVGVYVTTS